MKLRTRVGAALLTAAMVLQAPLAVFAQDAGTLVPETANEGNIVVVDENGNAKTVTADQLNEMNQEQDTASDAQEIPNPEPAEAPEAPTESASEQEQAQAPQENPAEDSVDEEPADEVQEDTPEEANAAPGTVVYWNPGDVYDGTAAGNDENDGLTPQTPVLTEEAALAKAKYVAAQNGAELNQITVYLVNPLDVQDDKDFDFENVILQAWDGRNYDSDVLFYMDQGVQLTLKNVTLKPRSEAETEEDIDNKKLLWNRDGVLLLQNDVAVHGSMVLDFCAQESEKPWKPDAELADHKDGQPMIVLGENFAPADEKYHLWLNEQGESSRLQLVTAPYANEEQMNSFAAAFSVKASSETEWQYKVERDDSAVMMAGNGDKDEQTESNAPFALFAVRASGSRVYWNPGGEIRTNSGDIYPAGDDAVDGSNESFAVRTLRQAITVATVHQATIVCMQPVDLNDESAKQVLDYEAATNTYRLAPDANVDYDIKIENWSATHNSIAKVADDTTLYVKNIEITSQNETESALYSGDQLIEVANKGQLQLDTGAKITSGYVGLTFDNTAGARNAAKPVQVMDQTVAANIYCYGINAAPQWYGSELVSATDALVRQLGGEQAAGEHLLANFKLERANQLLMEQGGVSELNWNLIQGAADAGSGMTKLQSLYLFTQLNYQYIYVDSQRGDDANLGITCAYPVKTMKTAIETVKTQQRALKALRTQLSSEGVSKEELDKKYPLPSIIYACSPITVDSNTTWDWSEIQDFLDETGETHSITLRAHEEAGEDENTGRTLHSVPAYIVRVTKGAKLTLGTDVRIVRQLPLSAVRDQTNDSTTTKQTREREIICNRNAINVIDGAELVLTANANLTGMAPDGLTADSYTFRSYPGNGIVVGTTAPTMSYTYGSTSKGTITIDAGWTGSLSGFGRGVYANGRDTKVVMNGGVIEGNSSSQEGAGIYLTNYAAFEMNGGVIQGNTALYNGAGVYAQRYATVKINKGTIQNNKVGVGSTYCVHSSSYTSDYDGYVSGGAGIFVAFGAELTLGTEGGNNDDCLIQNNKSTVGSFYGIGVGSQRASITMYSGRVENNSPEVSEYQSNSEYGAGISAYQAKSLKILGGLIQKNGRSEAADSTAMRYLGGYGGGVYIHQDSYYQVPEEILIQNVTIQGNKAGQGGGIYYKNYYNGSGSDYSKHYKVLFKDIVVDSNIARTQGGGICTQSSYTPYSTLGLDNVKITNNRALGVGNSSSYGYTDQATGGGFSGGFTWAKNLVVKENSAETASENYYRADGGGIYLTASNFSNQKGAVMEDCVIEDNVAQGQGGGIWNSTGSYGLTITGNSSLTNNKATGTYGMGGGIFNGGSLTLNFTGAIKNTATGIPSWTQGLPAADNIYTYSAYNVRLLKGTFVGDKSIVGYLTGSTVGKIMIDPVAVQFEAGENGYAIHSANPRTQIVLLQSLPADKKLPISINDKNFKPGSVLVTPANMTFTSVPALKVNENAEVGGLEVDSKLITYPEACKDASVNNANMSVSAQPSRAQFAPVPDTANAKLTNMGFVGEGVYLDGQNGDDTNTGLSPAAAVKTFEVAKQRLQDYVADENRTDGFRPVIWVCGTVTIDADTTMTLKQADVDAAGLARYNAAELRDQRTPDKVCVQRYAPMNDRAMFKLTGGTLTLNTIKLNGNAESVTAPTSSVIAPILLMSGADAKLVVDDGARLYNNLNTALIYVANGKSITVQQSYTTSQTDTVNDEKYGAQLDASKNQNGTRCAYLIQAANLPQTLDFTMSGTAWLNTANPSSSYSSDAYGFYVTGAGANVTMQDNAQIQGRGSSSYDEDAIYISSPSQDVSVLMQDNAKIQYTESAIYVYGPQAKCNIRMQQNASINSYDYGIKKEYAGSASKAAITLADSAKISASYAISVSDNNVANATTVDLIDSSSVTGGYGIYLTGSSTAAAVTMSNNAKASRLSDYRSASSVRASLTMKDSAAIDYIYRSYAGCLDVTMLDNTRVIYTVRTDSGYGAAQYGSLNLTMGRKDGTDSPTIGGSIYEFGGRMKLTMYANAKVNNNVCFDGLASKLNNDTGYGIEMYDNAKIQSSGYVSTYSSYEYVTVSMQTGTYYGSGSSKTNTSWNTSTPFSIILHDKAVIANSNSSSSTTAVIGFINHNNLDATMGIDQTIELKDNSSLQGGGVRGVIGSELAAGGTKKLRIGTVKIEDNAYVTSGYTTAMSSASYPIIQAQKVILNNSSTIPAMVKDTSAREQWGKNVSIEADDLQLCGEANVDGSILLTGLLDPQKNPTPITLTSEIPGDAAESKYRLQLRDTFMGLPVVQGKSGILGLGSIDASKYLRYFAMSVGLGDAAKMSLIANVDSGTIDLSRPMNVYLSSNGDDRYDGSSPARAVRTFTRAKYLLQTGEGYGEGSDIIVPDTVAIQSGDTDWSFDDGGTLTNQTTNETWKPRVRRNYSNTYTYPMVSVNITANFHDITLDGGGDQVTFNSKMQNCGFSLLYISGGTVTLGQNTVLTNLDYNASGTTFANDSLGGGFGLTVSGSSTTAIINGAVIENIKVRNYNRSSDGSNYYYNYEYADVSVVSVRSRARLEMNEGSIRNNSLDFYSYYYPMASQNAQAIVSVMRSTFTLNGGEIANNKLQSDANSYIPKGIVTVTGNSYSSSDYGTFKMNGGEIRENTCLTNSGANSAGAVVVGNYDTNGNSSSYTRNEKNNFTMNGGSITKNRARYYPAMHVCYGSATMVGGLISGNIVVDSNNNEIAADKLTRNQQPIYVNSYKNITRLILEGGGCQIDDGIFTQTYPIIVSKPIRNANRVYTVYPSRTNMGAVVVQPDGASLISVAPYAGNFDIRVNGRVASAGKAATDVKDQVHSTGTMAESSCIVLYKPVFVNGVSGTDPTRIDMNTGAINGLTSSELGQRPDTPVKTLDAAVMIGQANDSLEGSSTWSSTHNTYANYFVVFVTGSIKNERYTGNYVTPSNATAGTIKLPNTDPSNITYSLSSPAYIARYTGFDVITRSGVTVGGKTWYNYDHVFDLCNPGNVTLKNIEVYGRRLTDGTDKAGEALIGISEGVTLTVQDGTLLANNFANGNRPTGDDTVDEPMTMRGGAVRIKTGGKLLMQGGNINNTQAVYGNAIYIEQVDEQLGTLMLQKKPQIDGSIYLAGDKTVINADASYQPASSVNVAMQNDYNGRVIVKMTDGTPMDKEHQNLYGLTDSIRAFYEVKPDENDETQLVLYLKSVYYLDPLRTVNGFRNGLTADTAFKSLDELYNVLGNQSDLNGVMVYVVNPITVDSGKTLKIVNASKTTGVNTKYYSIYTNQAGQIKRINTQVYFKRYVQPKQNEGGAVPTNFTSATNKSMLFDIKGTLTLKGVCLDGHSLELEDSVNQRKEEALVAEAPLVRVEPTGNLICDATSEVIDGQNTDVAATIFTNSTNGKAKTNTIPDVPGIREGSSAGLEILSDASNEGKVTLQKAEFTNLALDTSKETFVGGAAIYVNGKLIAGESTFIEDSIYLEGQGIAGTNQEALKLQKTSRYITISKPGTPFRTGFMVLMRDAYNGRLVVRYPAVTAAIDDSNLSKYLLHDEVSRYYLLKEFRNTVDSTKYQDLCLYAPDAVYLDPLYGNDSNEGFVPAKPVRTLEKAFNQIKVSSAKVLYIMNEVQISTNVSITHADFMSGSTKITMPNTKHLMIRRFAKPDTATADYNKADYLGSLFAVKNGGNLDISGNVEVDGLREGTRGNHIPAGQTVTRQVLSKAALIRIENGGQLFIGMNEDTGEPVKLMNNDNSAQLSLGETAHYGGALEIQEGGTVTMNGGSLENNQSRLVPKTKLSESEGQAHDVYSNNGTLIVAKNPKGLAGSNNQICLDNGAVLTMQMLLNDEEETKDLKYNISVMDPEVGRDVVVYDGYTDVDAEHIHYVLGATVPKRLFLVQAANQSNVLELQDWKYLNVEVPEEVFLGIHLTSNTKGPDGNIPTKVQRIDVDGTQYKTPEYTVKNNGLYEAVVTVTSFVKQDTKTGADIPLATAQTELSSTDPKLYLALAKSSETQAEGNKFAALTETPLTQTMSLKMGVLKAGEHGSFAFTGAANGAFMNTYMDNAFPGASLDSAAKKMAYMRNKNGNTVSRNNATAWFKMRYRIELATPRR